MRNILKFSIIVGLFFVILNSCTQEQTPSNTEINETKISLRDDGCLGCDPNSPVAPVIIHVLGRDDSDDLCCFTMDFGDEYVNDSIGYHYQIWTENTGYYLDTTTNWTSVPVATDSITGVSTTVCLKSGLCYHIDIIDPDCVDPDVPLGFPNDCGSYIWACLSFKLKC